MMLRHDEQSAVERLEVDVLKGGRAGEDKACGVEVPGSAALAVVRAAVRCRDRDRAGVVLAVREVCALREGADQHDLAVLRKVKRRIGVVKAADRACRRLAVAGAAVCEVDRRQRADLFARAAAEILHTVKLCGNGGEVCILLGFVGCGKHGSVCDGQDLAGRCRADRLILADRARAPGHFEGVCRDVLRGAVDVADLGIPRDLHLGGAELHTVPTGGGEVQGRDIGIAADPDVRRAGVFAGDVAREGDDVDLAAGEHRDVGIAVIFRFRVALPVLIAAEDAEGARHRVTGQLRAVARDGHALADGYLVVLCHDEQKIAERLEVHVLKGRFAEKHIALGRKFIDRAALAVVRAAVYAGQGDRTRIVCAVGERVALRELAADHDRAVLREVKRVIGCLKAADRVFRRRAVSLAAVREVYDGILCRRCRDAHCAERKNQQKQRKPNPNLFHLQSPLFSSPATRFRVARRQTPQRLPALP